VLPLHWRPVEYKPVEYKCCHSKVELNCEETQEKVCSPVEEMECEIIGWSDCQMYPCPVEVKKPKIQTEDFIEQTCDMVPHNITHIKKIPDCKNVTKRICTTLWDRDAQGNPVWKSEEDCKDVTWLECHDKEVPAIISTMKSQCRPGNELPYQTCTNDTLVETHMCQRCTALAGVTCKVNSREECIHVSVKNCTSQHEEDCSGTPYNIPNQEFVHQDKCLFDEVGNPQVGDDPHLTHIENPWVQVELDMMAARDDLENGDTIDVLIESSGSF